MKIHVARDGRRSGPYTPDEVRRGLTEGTLLPTDLAWTEELDSWHPLASLPGFEAEATVPSARSDPLPVPEIPLPVQIPAPPTEPQKSPGVAIVSLIFGLLSITVLPLIASIPAIVCGHVARSRIKRSSGTLGGAKVALAGLIMGYVSFAMLTPVIAILATQAIPAFKEARHRALETKSVIEAKQIVVACKLYAVDHQGHFPQKLEELVPQYLPDDSLFACPLSDTGESMGYQYFGGTDNDAPTNILLVSKTGDPQGKHVVAYVDGSGEMHKYPVDRPVPPKPDFN